MSFQYMYQAQAAYKDFFNEVHGDVDIAGGTYTAADVVSSCDPTAYRCGFLDWCDSNGYDTDEMIGDYEE